MSEVGRFLNLQDYRELEMEEMNKHLETKLAKKGHSNPSKGASVVEFQSVRYVMKPDFLKAFAKYVQVLVDNNYHSIRHPEQTDFGFDSYDYEGIDEDEVEDEATRLRDSIRKLEEANRYFKQAISNALRGQNPYILFRKGIQATSEAYDIDTEDLVWFDDVPSEFERLLDKENKSPRAFCRDVGIYI